MFQILENLHLPQDCLLITCDVEALFTNTPIQESIDEVCIALANTNIDYGIKKPKTVYMRQLLDLVLKHNCFEFGGKYYQKVIGSPMGSASSPEICDIWLHAIEKKFIEHNPNILKVMRFKDDMVFCFKNDEAAFHIAYLRVVEWVALIRFLFGMWHY